MIAEITKKNREPNNTGPRVKNNKNNNANNESNNFYSSLNKNLAPAPAPVPVPVPVPAPAPISTNTKKEPVKFSNNRIGNFSKLLTNNQPQRSPQTQFQPRQPQQQLPRQPYQPQQPQQQPPRQPYQPKFQPQQFPKKESYYIGRMTNEELRHQKDIESSGDRHCTDDALECKLTKKQMCEKITYHFIVVNNLIATIVSVVPFPNENGNYVGSITIDRMNSLKNGVFCLPPHHSEIMAISSDERLHRIFKYINILPSENMSYEETCKKNGGFVLKLSKEHMDELGRDDEFGRRYFEFLKKINLFYQEALLNLYNILENLQNNTSISTRRLNELSARTKQIIDELYLKTQFNYLMAILVILDFNFAKNTEETEARKKRIKFIKEIV